MSKSLVIFIKKVRIVAPMMAWQGEFMTEHPSPRGFGDELTSGWRRLSSATPKDSCSTCCSYFFKSMIDEDIQDMLPKSTRDIRSKGLSENIC